MQLVHSNASVEIFVQNLTRRLCWWRA